MTSIIIPPDPSSVESHTLISWHQVYKIPWEVLIGLDYVDGAGLALHTGQGDAVTTAQGEITPDNTDQTHLEKELSLSGEKVFIVSTSASDTNVMAVVGVNAEGDCETTVLALNGTTPVEVTSAHVTNFWFNVNRIANGGTAVTVGTVYCSTKSDAGTPVNTDNIQCKMAIGTEFASNPMVMAGDDEVLVFIGMDISTSLKDQLEFRIGRRLALTRPWIKAFKVLSFESFLPYRFTVPIVIGNGQKIVFTIANSTGSPLDMTWQANFYSMNAAVPPDGTGVDILFGPTI